MGGSLYGRPTRVLVQPPRLQQQPSSAGFRPALPSDLGLHGPRVHQRGGHAEHQAGRGKRKCILYRKTKEWRGCSSEGSPSALPEEAEGQCTIRGCKRLQVHVPVRSLLLPRPLHVSGGAGTEVHPLPNSGGVSTRPTGPNKLTFRAWAFTLLSRILKTRSPFAAFLLSTLRLPAGLKAPAHALFPLPLPSGAVEDVRPGLASRTRERIGVRRLVHIIVAALNYVHNGRVPPALHLLRRRPNEAQQRALNTISALVRACGAASCNVQKAGRRTSQLTASLSGLCETLAAEGHRWIHAVSSSLISLDLLARTWPRKILTRMGLWTPRGPRYQGGASGIRCPSLVMPLRGA